MTAGDPQATAKLRNLYDSHRLCEKKYIVVMISKDHMSFNLSDISTYRTPLMGIATMMIIICHAEASGVLIPGWLAGICSIGNYGVDIFLFLSGLGVYYSIHRLKMNGGGIFGWYKKRFFRIFIPYLLIYVPYCLILLLLKEYSFTDSVLCLTALEYWLFHRGAWFVSLILVLYIIAPLLHKYCSGTFSWLWTFCFILALMVLSSRDVQDATSTNVVNNIQCAFRRVPSFILGLTISNGSKSNTKISVFWILLSAILWVLITKFFHLAAIAWLIVPLFVYLFVAFIKLMSEVSWVYNSLDLLGEISLESYLTNITVNSLLKVMIPAYLSSSLFYGRYLEYGIVVVVGLIGAYVVHLLTNKLSIK